MKAEDYQLYSLVAKNERFIDRSILVFIILMLFSGLCSFSLVWATSVLLDLITSMGIHGQFYSFIYKMHQGLFYLDENYSFMRYRTDWMAFSHIMLAVLFIGPKMDPYKNSWVVRFGYISALLALPVVFIFGSIRKVPVSWRIVDGLISCTFAVLLYISYLKIKANMVYNKKIEKIEQQKKDREKQVIKLVHNKFQ